MLNCKIAISFIAGLFLLLSTNSLHAADAETDIWAIWNRSKQAAFSKAKAEGKLVILLAGKTTCGNCKRAKALIEEEPLKSVVDKNYTLWYIEWLNSDSIAEAKSYINEIYEENSSLPYLFIINPYDSKKSLRAAKGNHTAEMMKAFLDPTGLPVANEEITVAAGSTYILDNTLYISNDLSDEKISVYSIAGTEVVSFAKKETQGTFSTTNFPKGILIIRSSSGWSTKVINK